MRRATIILGLLITAWAADESQAVAQGANRGVLADDSDFEEFVAQPIPERPQPERPAAERADEAARAARRASRNEYVRLARVPNMLGDSIGVAGQLMSFPQLGTGVPPDLKSPAGTIDLPFAVGRAFRIAENNKPIPMDRIYFNYNGFQNALTSGATVPPGILLGGRDSNVNLYTLGFEKTFFDGNDSLDVRIPFMNSLVLTDTFGNQAAAGNMGDVTMILKHLLYRDSEFSLAAGVGVGLPSAQDITGKSFGQPFRIHTEAVHLMPYIGALVSPNDNWFFQGFLQMDFAASGNPVTTIEKKPSFGTLTEQNLLIANLSAGRWLFRDPDAYRLQGIAAVVELHYTTTVQDADLLSSPPNATSPSGFILGNAYNRVDVLNLTAGLQVQIGPLSNLRVASAVPLSAGTSNRWFDSEILVSFNRYF